MAQVTLSPLAAGSDVGPLAADTLFTVVDGAVEYSTDAGTTYQQFGVGYPRRDIIFASGLTVKVRNPGQRPATFAHQAA